MKKKYIQPISMVVVMVDALCQAELNIASVVNGNTGKSEDHIKIENENDSSNKYNWGTDSWGGD